MSPNYAPAPEKEQRLEGQELYCHNCARYVQYADDLAVNGRRNIVCPNCGHHHYRIVRDGKITEDRWGQDPSQNVVWQITGTCSSVQSSYTAYSSSTSGTTNSASFQSRLDQLVGAT